MFELPTKTFVRSRLSLDMVPPLASPSLAKMQRIEEQSVGKYSVHSTLDSCEKSRHLVEPLSVSWMMNHSIERA
jgi:hypothetical protein